MRISVKLLTAGVVFFALLTAFFGCQKDGGSDTLPTTASANNILPKITVENGMLKFASSEDFKVTYNYLVNHQDQVANFNKKFVGFISNLDAYNQLVASNFNGGDLTAYKNVAYWETSDGEKYTRSVIKDPIYAVIFNADALVNVGTHILKMSKNSLYYIDIVYSINNSAVKNMENSQLANSIPLIPANYIPTRANGRCDKVYDWDASGNQKKKLVAENFIASEYAFSQTAGIYKWGIVGTGLSSRSFSRGFAGAWYSYPNVEMQIVSGTTNVKNKPNTSELSTILRGVITSASSKHDIKDLIANGKKTFCSF